MPLFNKFTLKKYFLGVEGGVKGKGCQKYGDGRWLDFGGWAHNIIYRWCTTELYTGNQYNLINQHHPNKFNLKRKYFLYTGLKSSW